MDYLINPITIAVIVTILVFVYLYWQNERNSDPNTEKKSINYLVPLLAGALTWIVLSMFMGNNNDTTSTAIKIQNLEGGNISKSNLISNINRFKLNNSPPTDIFIDIVDF